MAPWLPCAVTCAFLGCSDDEEQKKDLVFKSTVETIGADPLAGTSVQACSVYQESKCTGEKLAVCAVYDTGTKAFVESVDPVFEKVLMYDRWYDKYSSPLGLTMERTFTGEMPGNSPEGVWGDVGNFARWAGSGDAAIWTGVGLVAAFYRYVETRTEADYQRMEDKARALVRNFEVTGIPGYLSRYHFLHVPPGTPQDDRLIMEPGTDEDLGTLEIELPSLDVEGLPSEYTQGVPDGQGGTVVAKAYWDGDPSIDQYTGPMTSFPLVYPHLRDETLKRKMVRHLTCYLKRLQRIEIVNLKARPDLVKELTEAFGGAGLKLDPGDPNPSDISELVWYVHPGINTVNADTFDESCPESIQTEPSRVIDAKSDSFELDLLALAADIDRSTRKRQTQIDHFYIPSIRGGDASHLLHLSAIAYWMTGDEQYKRFMTEDLLGSLRAGDVMKTMMAYRLPDWCFKFYGDHITYPTHWQFITMLEDGDLKQQLVDIMETEVWQKGVKDHHSAKADVMYASVVPDGSAHSKSEAITSLQAQLRGFVANGGTDLAPRRTHNVSRQSVIDRLPSNISVRCPTEEERLACETETTLLGFPLESAIITRECDGRPGECVMSDGKCADGLASSGLPVALRAYADFLWQRSPYNFGEQFAVDGQKQSPGLDLSEPFWMARHYGFMDEGAGQVLAWRETNDACE